MRLKELREEKGISQARLANCLGVVKSTICLYENGRREPDIATLIKLANYFGVSVDYLLGRETPRNADLTEDEAYLLECYNRLTSSNKETLFMLIKDIFPQTRDIDIEKIKNIL